MAMRSRGLTGRRTSRFSGPGARVARPPAAERNVGQTNSVACHHDARRFRSLKRVARGSPAPVTSTVICFFAAILLLVAPLAAEAQQAGKVYRIGYLSAGSRESQEP